MYQIISQIIVYITLAAIIGFIVGWLFSKIKVKENGESIENILNDELAIVKAKKNELEEELIAKSSEYMKISEYNDDLKKKYLALEMDYEELLKQKSEPVIDDEYIQKLENEKFTLIKQLEEAKKKEQESQSIYSLLEQEKNNTKTHADKVRKLSQDLEKQKMEFAHKLNKLQSENKFLLDRLNVVEEEKLSLTKSIEQIKENQIDIKEFDKIKQELLDSKEKLKDTDFLKSYIKELESENTILKNKTKDADEVLKLRDINKELVLKIKSLEDNNEQLKSNISKLKVLEEENRSLKEKTKNADEVLKLRDLNKELVLKTKSLEKEKDELRSNLSKIQELEKTVNELKIQNTNLKEKASHSEEVEKLREINNNLIDKLTKEQKQNESLNERIKILTKDDIKIDILKRENEILKSSIETIKKEKEKLSLNIDDIKNKITDKKLKELNDLRTNIAKIEAQNSKLLEKLSQLQDENIKLKKDIENLIAQKEESIKEEVHEIKTVIEPTKEETSIVNNIFTELNALKDELKELQKAKEERECITEEHLIDLDDKIHVIDRDKILSFKIQDNYFSKLNK